MIARTSFFESLTVIFGAAVALRKRIPGGDLLQCRGLSDKLRWILSAFSCENGAVEKWALIQFTRIRDSKVSMVGRSN